MVNSMILQEYRIKDYGITLVKYPYALPGRRGFLFHRISLGKEDYRAKRIGHRQTSVE